MRPVISCREHNGPLRSAWHSYQESTKCGVLKISTTVDYEWLLLGNIKLYRVYSLFKSAIDRLFDQFALVSFYFIMSSLHRQPAHPTAYKYAFIICTTLKGWLYANLTLSFRLRWFSLSFRVGKVRFDAQNRRNDCIFYMEHSAEYIVKSFFKLTITHMCLSSQNLPHSDFHFLLQL